MLANLRDGILVTSLPAGLKPHPDTLFNVSQEWRAEAEAERVLRDTVVPSGATGEHKVGDAYQKPTVAFGQQAQILKPNG